MDQKPSRLFGPPTEKEVKEALAKLVVAGVDAVWLPEVQPLLRLPSVQEKAAELGEDHLAEALRTVLSAAVEDMGESQYRQLLTIVLGLDADYAALSAGAKRAVAGERFRGGVRKVSAGTIRQHHEPRALDELASRLVSSNLAIATRAELSGGLSSGVAIAWHPELHRRLGEERLLFVRLSFGIYRSQEAIEGVRTAMERCSVRSWSMYELFGLFDAVVRAWVPAAEAEHQVITALMQTLEQRLDLIEAFTVDRILLDSMWDAGAGFHETTSEHLPRVPTPLEIERVSRAAASEDDLARFEAEGLLRRQPPSSTGIGFFVAVSLQGHALVTPQARHSFERGIEAIVRDAEALADIEIYGGFGFAHFLIKGTIRSPDLTDLQRLLLRPLAALDAYQNMRTSTFLCSTTSPVFSVESLASGLGARTLRAEELLQREEGPAFEVKAAVDTNVTRWLATNEKPSEPSYRAGREGLLLAITAMLNSDGGTVLIGALEEQAVQRIEHSDHPLLSEAPRIGPYLVGGIDFEMPTWDAFQLKLVNLCREAIQPDPTPFLRIESDRVEGRTVCLVQVSQPAAGETREWFYLAGDRFDWRFAVRQGAQSVVLVGPDADRFKRGHGDRQ